MKMKNWTRSAGFTLVELIVVIAILGILSAGAAVGYSGYVKKANKAADEALVAQVKYALELAAINGDITEGGTIVLKANGNPEVFDEAGNAAAATSEQSATDRSRRVVATFSNTDPDPADTSSLAADKIVYALENAFGSEWKSALQLQYDGWSNGISEILSSLEGSSYSGKEGALLKDVQKLTDAVNSMFGEGGLDKDTINALLNGQSGTGAFSSYLESAGISDVASAPQEAANSVTLFVAQQVNNLSASQKDALRSAWTGNAFSSATVGNNDAETVRNMTQVYTGQTGLSTIGAMAAYYANAEAMINYLSSSEAVRDLGGTTPEGYDALVARVTNAFNQVDFSGVGEAVANANDAAKQTAAINSVYTAMATAFKDINTILRTSEDSSAAAKVNEAINNYTKENGQAAKDVEAYIGTMSAVDQLSDNLKADLSKTNMYGDGKLETIINSYKNIKNISSTDGCICIIAPIINGICEPIASSDIEQ